MMPSDYLFLLVLSLVPSLTYPLICVTYFLVLNQKRKEVDRLVRGKTLTNYLRAYGQSKEGELFARYYDWKGYILPIILNMMVVIGASFAMLARGKIENGTAPAVLSSIISLPVTAIVGLAGAYIWGHYEMIRRFSSIDLSPVSFFFMWLRFLISGILSYIVGLTLRPPLDLLVAFGIGAFPINSLLMLVRSQAREQLKFSGEIQASEKPSLQYLQGMSAEMVERLQEENIYSAQHLALVNPIRLLMKTSFEWTVILDLIDQALLYNYVGEKITDVRQVGIRCAMELSDVKVYLESRKDTEKEIGNQLVCDLAKRLGWETASVKNMIETLAYDTQLNFISNLWDEALSDGESSD